VIQPGDNLNRRAKMWVWLEKVDEYGMMLMSMGR
jgi:hypothetical protein